MDGQLLTECAAAHASEWFWIGKASRFVPVNGPRVTNKGGTADSRPLSAMLVKGFFRI